MKKNNNKYMELKQIITKELELTQSVITKMLNDTQFQENVYKIAQICIDALKNGNKILFCGNGGSAADSQHLAAELVSRFNFDRPGLCGIALTTDTSALTAIGNDYGYDKVFSRQIEAIGRNGDILFGFSTSGRSKNIVMAFETAKAQGLKTIGMLGEDGKDIGKLADEQINIPSHYTPKIQEGHICIGHIICNIIEVALFQKSQ
jgi:D-sedoheptulose 7-phosphate isomerase